MGGSQSVAAILGGQEDGDPRDQQGPRQSIDDGAEQRVQIGLRAEAATEFDECLAIVVSPAVEDAVNPRLDGALERVEELRGDDDGGDQSPGAEARKLSVDGSPTMRDQQRSKARPGRRWPGYK